MRAVLFGAPGSGRKTLMQALSDGAPVPAGRKTVATIRVGDERVPHLSGMFNPKKTTWSTIEISFEDFLEAGSLARARSKGTFRLEGKEYIVKDGDIISFRFNV